MIKKSIIIALIIAAGVHGQSAGNSGLSFLKLGFGARNIALADNGSIMADDATALFYNPANLNLSKGAELFIMHNEWIQDIRSELLGAKFYAFGLPIAVGINSTTVSNIEVRQIPGEKETEFNAHYFFGSLSTGFTLINDLSFGLTFKYINEDILRDYAAGYGLDFGFNYLTPIERLRLSAVLRNVGSMKMLRNESSKLPSEFRIGVGYSYDLAGYKTVINVGGELQKYFNYDDLHFNLGAEFVYDNLIALRAGYQTFYESKSFTGGIGLAWGSLRLDYALTPFEYSLGTGHSFSINYKFN